MNEFNYNEFYARIKKEQEEAGNKAKKDLKLVVKELKKKKIETVNINFDGSGDSGQINYIHFNPDINDEDNLRDRIEEFAEQLLQSTGVDWYNNEGGFGEINIDVQNKTYNFEVNQRIEAYELAASGQEKI
jgi:hypothetical protein